MGLWPGGRESTGNQTIYIKRTQVLTGHRVRSRPAGMRKGMALMGMGSPRSRSHSPSFSLSLAASSSPFCGKIPSSASVGFTLLESVTPFNLRAGGTDALGSVQDKPSLAARGLWEVLLSHRTAWQDGGSRGWNAGLPT